MEASQGGGGGGGAEVRRLHVVYFLSRKGRIEHPHLVRVQHHSRNGVRLRDIKRWLGELRGKDMPDSFSWSYKRRYKTGYVWQDLLDDDLITPISDNEYVLKGSEISSSTAIKDLSYTEKKSDPMQKDDHQYISHQESCQSHSSETFSTSNYISTKSSSEIEEESPTFGSETSTLTDDSGKLETKFEKQEEKSKKMEKPSSRKNTEENIVVNKKLAATAENLSNNKSSSTTKERNFGKSKSNSSSNIFRNLITCGAVDTNDSAVMPMKSKQNNGTLMLKMCANDLKNVHSAEVIARRDRFGGSQRILGATPMWSQQQWAGRKSFDGAKVDPAKEKSDSREQRTASSAHKTVNWPNCSQCGKPFKPEKLHAHMKSCKGMKAAALSKSALDHPPVSAVVATNTSKGSSLAQNESSVSAFLLTH